MAKAQVLDMTNVSEGRMFNKKRYPEGDYPGTITKVDDVRKKDDKSKKMWLFTIKVKGGVYPYYCGFGEKELWKIKNLWVAAGVALPAKKVKMDPNKLVNKEIGVTLEDDEYDGKAQSSIASTFPVSELEGIDDVDEEEEPKAKKGKKDKGSKDKAGKAAKGKKSKKGAKPAVDDDELEALDVEEV